MGLARLSERLGCRSGLQDVLGLRSRILKVKVRAVKVIQFAPPPYFGNGLYSTRWPTNVAELPGSPCYLTHYLSNYCKHWVSQEAKLLPLS